MDTKKIERSDFCKKLLITGIACTTGINLQAREMTSASSSPPEGFESGKLYINGKIIEIDSIPWTEHQTFKGVFSKILIKGEQTQDQLSCHLVRVNPGCEIGSHIHEGKTEIHEILRGSASSTVGIDNRIYEQGCVCFIPPDINHSVKANQEGLLLLAKFFPALA
jgi:quercetin dioxygenase-like cupin family protein